MPLGSHMIQGAPPGTGKATGEIIIVKYTHGILYNEGLLPRKISLPEPHLRRRAFLTFQLPLDSYLT